MMQPKGLLMRVGIDQTFGQFNAPINPETYDYLYMPIPEDRHEFKQGMETSYADIVPHFNAWAVRNQFDEEFPAHLRKRNCHLDPDFECLTYGDQGSGRGNRVRQLVRGDFVAFFASFKPIRPCSHKLIYALFGLMVVEKVVKVAALSKEELSRNAHSRVAEVNQEHLVVIAQPEQSGRFEKAIPIGEYRNGAYRVAEAVSAEWGGLTVRDGFIQRSVCPPWFTNASKFAEWMRAKQVALIHNNY